LNSLPYTFDYFIEMAKQQKASYRQENVNLIIWGDISKALASNPNLTVSRLARLLAFNDEHDRIEIIKMVLARTDKKQFMDLVFSVIESTEANFAVYVLSTAILSDLELRDYHQRAIYSLTHLKERRDYNSRLNDFLPGPCLSYNFFIMFMLKSAGSAEEVDRWLAEYGQCEALFQRHHEQVFSQGLKDSSAREKLKKEWRERERRSIYRNLAENPNLPAACFKKIYAYVDTIDDETSRVAYWCKLLSNPGIPPEDYREIFETKRRNLRNKAHVLSLFGAIARNPEHFRLYYDYIFEYINKKPTDAKNGIVVGLLANPELDTKELGRVMDFIAGKEYSANFNAFDPTPVRVGSIFLTLAKRRDLTEEHQAQFRKLIRRFLAMAESYGSFEYVDRSMIDKMFILQALSSVKPDQEFVDFLSGFAVKKPNGGMYLSGLLPNPWLTEEWYARIVNVLEEQYVGQSDRFLISQRSTFFPDKVYALWPASKFVT
jgi:hypothetical protein